MFCGHIAYYMLVVFLVFNVHLQNVINRMDTLVGIKMASINQSINQSLIQLKIMMHLKSLYLQCDSLCLLDCVFSV